MATTNTATLKFKYEDGDERSITFEEVPTSALQNFKTNVLTLNATIADSVQGAAYRETFVSDDGAPIARIIGAKYTVTEETTIYGN